MGFVRFLGLRPAGKEEALVERARADQEGESGRPESPDVKRVEARLGDTTRSVAELFSEAEVEEWRCSWQAR